MLVIPACTPLPLWTLRLANRLQFRQSQAKIVCLKMMSIEITLKLSFLQMKGKVWPQKPDELFVSTRNGSQITFSKSESSHIDAELLYLKRIITQKLWTWSIFPVWVINNGSFTLLFFVIGPGDLIVTEDDLELLHRHRVVCFAEALEMSKIVFTSVH